MSEVVLLLLNTDRLQQVEDYVRGCSSSTKYWQTSASWGLCQRLFFFYQILTDFSKLRIMSEVVLLNTGRLQQVEDYVRDWSSSTKYWQTSASWWLCQRLYMTIKRAMILALPSCTESIGWVLPRSCSWRFKLIWMYGLYNLSGIIHKYHNKR